MKVAGWHLVASVHQDLGGFLALEVVVVAGRIGHLYDYFVLRGQILVLILQELVSSRRKEREEV